MMLKDAQNQQQFHFLYDASGTITSGGTAQLILPQAISRSFLGIWNVSDTAMYLEFGSARATATLTSGVVTSIAVGNGGFGFTVAPEVIFMGGGDGGNTQYLSAALPEYPSPGSPVGFVYRGGDLSAQRPARAHATMSGSAPNMTVNAIVIDDGGAGYNHAPLVFLRNRHNDPYGCATPSATSGILLPPAGTTGIAGSMVWNGTCCPTDSVAVFCATTGKAFCCKFMI